MLKNILGNKKIIIAIGIVGLLIVFCVSFILGYTNAVNNKDKEIVNKEIVSETKKEPKEVETKEQVSSKNETKEDISNEWIDYHTSSFGIILSNNEIQLSSLEESYPNLEPWEDDAKTDKRFIIPEIDASLKIPKDYSIRYKKSGNGPITYRLEPTDNITGYNGYIEILAVPSFIKDDKDIYDIAAHLYEEKYVEINQYLNWKYYKINNSHIAMYYHRPVDNITFAIMRDANGNLISIGASHIDDAVIFDMMVNYESFGTAGFRFIEQEDRDKIYVDTINAVSMK